MSHTIIRAQGGRLGGFRGHDPDQTPPSTEDAGLQTVVVFISDSTIFDW